MKTMIVKCFAATALACGHAYSSDSDVRLAVEAVATEATSLRYDADVVREWGLDVCITTQTCFTALVNVLSNNQGAVVSDWSYYSTNAFAREILMCASHYGSLEMHLGVYSNMLNAAELMMDTNFCKQLTMYSFAAATPLENYMALHYEDPSISNLWNRSLDVFANHPLLNGEVNYITNWVTNGKFKCKWNVDEAAGLHN